MTPGKGYLCPRCDRFTFRAIISGAEDFICSKCGYTGKLPEKEIAQLKVKRKNAPEPLNHRFPDPSKLYIVKSSQVKNNVDLKLVAKYREYINSILELSLYESKILSCLLAATSPLSARNLMFLSGVPRTKVYGTLKALNKAGLVNLCMIDIVPDKLPEIYEWWPEHKQGTFMKSFCISLHVYSPDREAVEQAYKRHTEAFGMIAMTRRRIQIHETYEEIKR